MDWMVMTLKNTHTFNTEHSTFNTLVLIIVSLRMNNYYLVDLCLRLALVEWILMFKISWLVFLNVSVLVNGLRVVWTLTTYLPLVSRVWKRRYRLVFVWTLFFFHSRSGQSTLRTQTDKLFCHSLTKNNFSFHFIFVKKLKLKRNCVRHMKLWNGQQWV